MSTPWYNKLNWDQQILLQPQSGVSAGIVSLSTYSAGELPLNGSLIVDDIYNTGYPQWIDWVCTGDESSNYITITGVDSSAREFVFVQQGTNADTVTIEIPYIRITSISVKNNSTGTISIGTNTLTGTCWFQLDRQRSSFNATLTCTVSAGSVLTYTAQTSQDFLYPPVNHQDDVTMNGLNSSGVTAFDNSTQWVRVVFETYTSGNVLVQLTQAGWPVSGKYS